MCICWGGLDFFPSFPPFLFIFRLAFLCFNNGEKKEVDEFADVVHQTTALRNDWPSR